MTITQAINQTETLVENIRPYAGQALWLIARDRKLLLVDCRQSGPKDLTITRLTRKEINEGLSSGEWGIVQSNIRQAIKENLL